MASARRIGAPDAKNRGVLLDAAEELLCRRVTPLSRPAVSRTPPD